MLVIGGHRTAREAIEVHRSDAADARDEAVAPGGHRLHLLAPMRPAATTILLALLSLGAPSARAADTVLPDGTVRFQTEIEEKDLTAESERVLNGLAKLLIDQPEAWNPVLLMHADDRGNEPLNKSLSLARADVVRQSLVKRGIAPARVSSRARAAPRAGIARDSTEDARALNRRVEVWVTPRSRREGDAHRSARRVSRGRDAPEWRPARTDLELRRYAKVRTMKQSASEVTFFQEQDRVTLGPSALVVIYDSPMTTASRRNLADVEIEKGSVFASLAAREEDVVRSQCRRSRVASTSESKRTRIDVSKTKKQSAIAVYEGRSTVSAKGKTVSVVEGFGTRVREGQVPEEPRPLPKKSPEDAEPEGRLRGRAPRPRVDRRARHRSRRGADRQLDDRAGEHPFRMWRVRGGQTTGGRARAGAYWLRLVAIPQRPRCAWPSARARRARTAAAPGRGAGAENHARLVRPKWPGLLELPVPPGLRLRVGTESSTRAPSRRAPPGSHRAAPLRSRRRPGRQSRARSSACTCPRRRGSCRPRRSTRRTSA